MKKTKRRHAKTAPQKTTALPFGMQPTKEVSSAEAKWPAKNGEEFTPMETGQPDQEPKADIKNPQGVQGGRGPLNEEGEGDRQNDQLAELEQIDPKADNQDLKF